MIDTMKQKSQSQIIYINSIMKNPSLCDGIGYRTVLFLQGCDLHCSGCHNKETWDIAKGIRITVAELADTLRQSCFNKELTISGGEPLMQANAVYELIALLSDFDICLYTGHAISEVPKKILDKIHYLKYGPYIEELKTTTTPFVGSINQVFTEISHATSE